MIMLDAICSEHDFLQGQVEVLTCAFGEHIATHTAAWSAFSFSFHEQFFTKLSGTMTKIVYFLHVSKLYEKKNAV